LILRTRAVRVFQDKKWQVNNLRDSLAASANEPCVLQIAYAHCFFCDCAYSERVIEYRLPAPAAPLTSLTLSGFVEAVGARSPAPGGGSVAALLGSLVIHYFNAIIRIRMIYDTFFLLVKLVYFLSLFSSDKV
jgi:Formiminotransferase-cyclodeaminase